MNETNKTKLPNSDIAVLECSEKSLAEISVPGAIPVSDALKTEYTFQDYIEFLRENLVNVVQYQERTGTIEPTVRRIKDDLFHSDPFVVFKATLAATAVLADKSIYH